MYIMYYVTCMHPMIRVLSSSHAEWDKPLALYLTFGVLILSVAPTLIVLLEPMIFSILFPDYQN